STHTITLKRGRHSTIVFFFQAEDGIRDFHVTGVQTCALPISHRDHFRSGRGTPDLHGGVARAAALFPPPSDDRHWRGVDRDHPRQGVSAALPHFAAHGLRQLHPPLLSRRSHHGRAHAQGGDGGPSRGRNHRAGV